MAVGRISDVVTAYQPQPMDWIQRVAPTTTDAIDADVLAIKKAAQKKAQALYYTDVQTSCMATEPSNITAAAGTQLQPKLDPPSRQTSAHPLKVATELTDFFEKIQSTDSEQLIWRLMRLLMQTQRELREFGVINAHEKVQMEQKFQKAKQKEEFRIQNEQDENSNALSKVNKFNTGFTIANVVTLVVGIFASIFTYGAAIPIVISCAQGLSSAGSAVTTGMGVHYKAIGDKLSKEYELVKHERGVSHGNVTASMKVSKEQMTLIEQLVKLQKMMMEQSVKYSSFNGVHGDES